MSESIGGVTGLSALNDLLDDYRVPPGSRATILEAVAAVQADGVTVEGRVVGAEVELGPVDGQLAGSVGRAGLTLTLDRRAAVRAAQQHEFCRIGDADGPTRVRLVMEQWALQQHAVVVRNLAVEALRAAVPRPTPTAPARRAVGGPPEAADGPAPRPSRVAKTPAAERPVPPSPPSARSTSSSW